MNTRVEDLTYGAKGLYDNESLICLTHDYGENK